jgi:periplasmic protein TonB
MSLEEHRWREFFPALAVSLALHAAAWQAYWNFSVENVPVEAPRLVEVALVAAPSKAEPVPPPPAPPPPPKPEPKPEKKLLPKKPAPPKPKPDIQPEPQAETPPAPPVSAPPVEKPPAPAPFVEANYRSASLNNPPTRYPRLALERRWEGQVLLRVRVLASGTAGEVRVERGSGHDVLDESASEQVKSWRFVPAREGNAPVDSWVIIPIEFKLKR